MTKLTPEEKITIETYNRQAKSWSTVHSTANFWAEEMANFKKLLPEGKILEIGAGAGRDAQELIDHGYEYLGTDISSGLLELARKNNPKAIFEQVSVYDVNFKEKFDGFWCSAVLLHIPREKINHALYAVNKNMKKGAFGFIAIKEGQGEQLETTDSSTGTDERYFVYWSDDEFSNRLTENGFTIVERGYKPMNERTKWLTYIVKTN